MPLPAFQLSAISTHPLGEIPLVSDGKGESEKISLLLSMDQVLLESNSNRKSISRYLMLLKGKILNVISSI